MSQEIKARLEHGINAAYEAAKVILASYQNPSLEVEAKRDKTVVTEADRAAEKKLREYIEHRYPNDGVIGEEFDEKTGRSGFKWILDPIDGTDAFVCGVPLFGTLVGLTYHDEPVAGVAHMPALNETYYAAKGQGSWWRPQGHTSPVRAHASMTARLSDSLFLTTSRAGFDRAGRGDLFDSLLAQSRKFRGWGSCYGHMLVATGRAELMVDPHVKLWDAAAIYPIVTEAGGRFFSLKGEPTIYGDSAISTNAAIEEEIKSILTR